MLPLLAIVCIHATAHAQAATLDGTWIGYYSDGSKSPYIWLIQQKGSEIGIKQVGTPEKLVSKGNVSGNQIHATDFNTLGIVSDARKTIRWSDGVVWRKEWTGSNLQGSWVGYFPDGTKSPYVWFIEQKFSILAIREIGTPNDLNSAGRIDGAEIIATDFNTKGTLSGYGDARKITWNDGVVWRREKPVNKKTYLSTHNAIASAAYGFMIQASQSYNITTQLDAGVRMLEIDIVFDMPTATSQEGMYVCHCGKAAHSNSELERERMKTKGSLNEITPFVPLWTRGPMFIRFGNVLKVIDEWLTRNPTEIVFVDLEINSGTADTIDREIYMANLKNRIYQKEPGAAWASKSELVHKNERLILLDNGLGKGSRYLTPDSKKVYIGHIWEDKVLNISSADYDNRVSITGAFETVRTSASAAATYNNSSYLNEKKVKWDANGKRFPTFIQFNQIQQGHSETLQFINSLNDKEDQISSVANFGAVKPNVDMSANPALLHRTPRNYTIKIKTGNQSGAGTDSTIYFAIYGDKAKTRIFDLNSAISGDAFEQGDLETITLVGEDVGKILEIALVSDTAHPGSAWYPEFVALSSNNFETSFTINKWIDSDNPTISFRPSK